MAQATYPVLTWATRSLFKMIEPYLVLLRVEFTLQPTVTSGPVRSYRTLSPLPHKEAVCFLWHFPSGRPGRTLSGAVFPWSPDFPPPFAWERSPDPLTLSGYADEKTSSSAANKTGATRGFQAGTSEDLLRSARASSSSFLFAIT